MLLSLLVYEDGELDKTSIIPMIDGGTEGFKGNARVILPGMSPCIDCTLDLYPPQVNDHRYLLTKLIIVDRRSSYIIC